MPLLVAASGGSLAAWGGLLAMAALGALWRQHHRRADGAEIQRRSVSLGGQHALHVVELDGRRLLVGTGPGAAPRLLIELAPPSEVPTGAGGDGG